jgi:hypothetical protein
MGVDWSVTFVQWREATVAKTVHLPLLKQMVFLYGVDTVNGVIVGATFSSSDYAEHEGLWFYRYDTEGEGEFRTFAHMTQHSIQRGMLDMKLELTPHGYFVYGMDADTSRIAVLTFQGSQCLDMRWMGSGGVRCFHVHQEFLLIVMEATPTTLELWSIHHPDAPLAYLKSDIAFQRRGDGMYCQEITYGDSFDTRPLMVVATMGKYVDYITDIPKGTIVWQVASTRPSNRIPTIHGVLLQHHSDYQYYALGCHRGLILKNDWDMMTRVQDLMGAGSISVVEDKWRLFPRATTNKKTTAHLVYYAKTGIAWRSSRIHDNKLFMHDNLNLHVLDFNN